METPDISEKPIYDLVQRLKSASLDEKDDWNDLHSWSLQYRNTNNLTAKEFLKLYNATPLPSFVQFLAAGGGEHVPSNRPGTVGKQLRDILFNARKSLPDVPGSTVENKSSRRERIEEYFLNEQNNLKALGIVSMFVLEEQPLSIKVGVIASCELTTVEIGQKFNINNWQPTVTTYVLEETIGVEYWPISRVEMTTVVLTGRRL